MMSKHDPSFLVQFQNGIQKVNDAGEIQRLHDLGIKFSVLGEICDDEEFGDTCSTDCLHFRQGTCPMVVLRDYRGTRWHVYYHEVHHNY